MVERLVARCGSSPSLLGAVAVLALALGCGRSNRHGPPRSNAPSDGGDTGMGTGGSAVAGGAGGSGGSAGSKSSGGTGGGDAGTAGAGGEAPEPTCGTSATGIVRLSFPQVKAALAALLGAEAAEAITLDLEIPPLEQTTLPALIDPREGTVITDSVFQRTDSIAQATGAYVREHLEAVTGCTPDPTDECARAFLEDFVGRAFRKPVESGELDLVLAVYDGARAEELGASVTEALEYGVYATIESPRFEYRLELGAPDAVAGTAPLLPHEVANALAFFLTSAPPDDELLAAATAGTLTSADDLAPHVARLLAGEAARARLSAAIGEHFGLSRVETIILDPTVFPAWNVGLQAAMVRETRHFLSSTLFSEPLASLLTSRTAWVNDGLAALYGVSFPPVGVTPDADGFATVDLPENRSGLLTQAAMLVSTSRPDAASVIGRGLWVTGRVLCSQNPPFPGADGFPADIEEKLAALGNATERQKAEFRMETEGCGECHRLFDPYGLALDEFDALGAYRQADAQGRPIDTAVTLPESLGSVAVADAAALGRVLAEREDLARCLGGTFLLEALSTNWTGPSPSASCEVDEIVRAFRAGDDPSFAGLVRAIALSPAFRTRTKAEAP